jgi:microcystin-dependent protein
MTQSLITKLSVAALFLVAVGFNSGNFTSPLGEETKNETTAVSTDPLIGEVIMFAGNFAPRGWAFCEGQLLPISQNTALFSIIGTTYGGDGRTTFGLPDLRGRVAVGRGQGPGLSNVRLGDKGGRELATLRVKGIELHKHPAPATANPNDRGSVSPTRGSGGTAPVGRGSGAAAPQAYTEQVLVPYVNGQGEMNTHQPYTGINYIIALQGVFPSRN